MDYAGLRVFLHLSRSLHFGRTSKECHVSPSALTRAIQRLEAEVGAALFERDKRTVKLTEEGRLLQAHARETLQRWSLVEQRLSHHAERLTGMIAIFASVTACQSFLPPLLSAFRNEHPDVHIRLETGYAIDALGMLRRGAVDVAVAALPDKVPAMLAAKEVLRIPLVFVAPASAGEASDLAERTPLPWADVPMVLPASGLARESADRWFRRRRVTPRVYGEVAGNEAILSLVSLGCGIGIVPRLVADQSPLRSAVRVLDVEPALPAFRVGVCTERRKLKSAIVRAFWESVSVGE